ncbi:hypothetical protein GMSM_00010 [Geomonas sp. Red276]
MKNEHFEIMLEKMDSNFQLVLDAYSALDRKIDAYREESNAKHDHTAFQIQVLNNKIDGVEERLTAGLEKVEDRLTRVEGRLDSVEEKLDTVGADLAAHRMDTEAHRGAYIVKEP